MFVNTGGGGKTQQKPLQNQTNASVRHNNPYPHTHTQQQQPHYEHQGPVTFVTYPFCNVTPAAAHGTTGGNAVAVGGGQPGHVLYQTSQAQPHPTQQQIGIHNAEQTLHYFTKSAPMAAPHLHHPSQQHTQIRNMIAAVSHQQPPYLVSPNYYALPAIQLPQQTRATLLTNAAPQHPVAGASGGSITTQLQNTTTRSVAPSGPTAYVPPPYCTPPLLLGGPPTAVTPQAPHMLTTATGIGQPTTLQAYAHMGGGIPTGSATPINIPTAVGLGVGTGVLSNTTEHATNTKPRAHAIPIINPDTLEIVDVVTVENKSKGQTQPNSLQPPPKSEVNVEPIVAVQNDTDDKFLTVSVACDSSDVVVTPKHSPSISATDTDKNERQIPNNDVVDNDEDEVNYDDIVKSDLAIDCISIAAANSPTQSIHSGSESLKIRFFEDPNDTDADANEHELDNDDVVLDTTDKNSSAPCIDQQLARNQLREQESEIISSTTDLVITQFAGECNSDHSTETEVKSKDEPCTKSRQTYVEWKIDEEETKKIQQDLQPSTTALSSAETKRIRKNTKRKETFSKKQQQSKSNSSKSINEMNKNTNSNNLNMVSSSTKNDDNYIAPAHLKAIGLENPNLKSEREEEVQITFIRYSLEELKAIAKSSESRKTPVVPCQKGDCISQLFVASQQHHHHQHHVQQSYHHMNFNESMEFVTGKRRVGGAGAGGVTRKHYDNHNNVASTGNNTNNIAGQSAASASAKPVIRIELSLKEEIKLSKCENAWQPKFLASNSNSNLPTTDRCKNDNDDVEDVLKKVRGILNKLTSENFDVLLKEMTSITINTQEKMQNVMLLIFEKTVSEPNFAPTYAKFSKVLFEEVKAESKKKFNALLITRLQTEFENNVNNADAKERKLQQIISKLNETTNSQEKIELQAELEYQEYQFRRRAWGTVRFIGEMYKLQSLSADRVLQCVESLLKHGNEEKLEYMCKLLTTVGNLLEGNNTEAFSNNLRMNKIFTRIQAIIKEAKEPNNKKTKICSRVRFMLQDLIELRTRNWGQSPNAHNSHASLHRRHPEDKNSNMSSSVSSSVYERGSAQRTSFAGNNNRHNQGRTKESGFSGSGGNYCVQKPAKSQFTTQREQQQSIDLKKLNFSREDSSQGTTKLGNSSIYKWRTIPSRQTYQTIDSQKSDRDSPTSLQYPQKYHQPQQEPQHQSQNCSTKNQDSNAKIKSILASYTNEENKKLLDHVLEEYLDCQRTRSNRWREEVLNIWQKTNNKQQICLIYYILMDYLHLANVKQHERNACANILIYLMNYKVFNKSLFTQAYDEFAEFFPDLLMDVPNGWTYVFEFLGPLLHERLLSITDIWHTNWRNDQQFTERFVNGLVHYFTKEFGANYMRDLWHSEFKLDKGQLFMSDQQLWRQFIATNKLQFLHDCNAKPEISSINTNNYNNNSSTIVEQQVQRLEILLSSPNDSNLALDYINTNVNINSYFLKNLTRFLCCDYATTINSTTTTTTTTTTSPTPTPTPIATASSSSRTSSTCSNTSSSINTKNTDLLSNSSNNAKKPQLNVKAFREICVPILRLCLDAHEDHELTCLDSVVDAVEQEYDSIKAYELICGIFDILYDCEVIAKESFEKWYRQRQESQKLKLVNTKNQNQNQSQMKRPLSANLEAFMQKLL